MLWIDLKMAVLPMPLWVAVLLLAHRHSHPPSQKPLTKPAVDIVVQAEPLSLVAIHHDTVE